jgi:uncharacterized protein YegL
MLHNGWGTALARRALTDLMKEEDAMPNDDLTAIAAVLDRSGSMQAMREDAMGGFNAFLEDQKKAPGKAELTVVLFDDQYELLCNAADIQNVDPLTEATYVPRGQTALYDAIGRTINVLKAAIAKRPEDEQPKRVILVVVTDGEENASKEFEREQIFEQLKKLKADENWKVMFLAADQDALQVGQSLGATKGLSVVTGRSKIGARAAYRASNAAVRCLRSGGEVEELTSGGLVGAEALYSQSLAADQGDGSVMCFSGDGVGTADANVQPVVDNTSDGKDKK